jgi:hypothetical protein
MSAISLDSSCLVNRRSRPSRTKNKDFKKGGDMIAEMIEKLKDVVSRRNFIGIAVGTATTFVSSVLRLDAGGVGNYILACCNLCNPPSCPCGVSNQCCCGCTHCCWSWPCQNWDSNCNCYIYTCVEGFSAVQTCGDNCPAICSHAFRGARC